MVIATHQWGFLPLHRVLSWLGGAGGTREGLEAKGRKGGTQTNLPLQPARSSSAEGMPTRGLLAPETGN